MLKNEQIKSQGDIEAIIEYLDGTKERKYFTNTIVQTGRNALASSIANMFGDEYDFFVNRMIFGDGGTDNNGNPKYVDSSRNGLFGIARANKPVISTIDQTLTSRAIFTSVLTSDDANGFTLNEMALQMNTGDFYSMATFAGIGKTSIMQVTFNWQISYV